MSNTRNYLLISATVFAIVALAHLIRAIEAWPIVFASWPVPVAASWLAAAATATLSLWALSLLRRRG